MKAPLTHNGIRSAAGMSAVELLIVAAMVFVVGGFAFFKLVGSSGREARTGVSNELVTYLERARRDSVRRNAKELDQMAQVRIFNRRFYSIAIDDDGDGNLDIPLVKNLPEQAGVEINGPFPKTYVFNWQGQTVDAQANPMVPSPLTIGDSSGASAIKFSDDGKIVVVPAVKLTASR